MPPRAQRTRAAAAAADDYDITLLLVIFDAMLLVCRLRQRWRANIIFFAAAMLTLRRDVCAFTLMSRHFSATLLLFFTSLPRHSARLFYAMLLFDAVVYCLRHCACFR